MMLRQWHTYIGALIAPSVLFFALTGIVQLFSLHEAHDGYKPPVLIEKLAAVHKDQKFEAKAERPHPHRPSAMAAARDDGDHEDGDHADADHRQGGSPSVQAPNAKQLRIYLLKWVFVLVALGLITSTLIGLWMAVTVGRRPAVTWLLLLIGAALPVLLLAL